MSPRLPIAWDALFLGDLPEDPGTTGYPAKCGVSGDARILKQVSEKIASQPIGSLGDIYFADTGIAALKPIQSSEGPNRVRSTGQRKPTLPRVGMGDEGCGCYQT
jgi:hypothetical protein